MSGPSVNPYVASESSPPELRRIAYKKRFGIAGAVVGIAIPVANVIYVFAWMWSRPSLPPGNYGYSGTPGVAALLAMVIGSPTLGLLFALVGAAVGAIIDNYRASRQDRLERSD